MSQCKAIRPLIDLGGGSLGEVNYRLPNQFRQPSPFVIVVYYSFPFPNDPSVVTLFVERFWQRNCLRLREGRGRAFSLSPSEPHGVCLEGGGVFSLSLSLSSAERCEQKPVFTPHRGLYNRGSLRGVQGGMQTTGWVCLRAGEGVQRCLPANFTLFYQLHLERVLLSSKKNNICICWRRRRHSSREWH